MAKSHRDACAKPRREFIVALLFELTIGSPVLPFMRTAIDVTR
ncbi:MAG: hypothetical protein QF570_18260 [Myxococcota bacterium]|jgi:hypothetical protein|nr:hypothetical protein [Myxococcota bacterium]